MAFFIICGAAILFLRRRNHRKSKSVESTTEDPWRKPELDSKQVVPIELPTEKDAPELLPTSPIPTELPDPSQPEVAELRNTVNSPAGDGATIQETGEQVAEPLEPVHSLP